MKDEISMKIFSEYLMEKLDLAKEYLTLEDFQQIEFSQHGAPTLIVDAITKITTTQLDAILKSKSKAKDIGKKKGKRK